MKIMNRLFATAFVALLLFASHSRAEQEKQDRQLTVQGFAVTCKAGDTDPPC